MWSAEGGWGRQFWYAWHFGRLTTWPKQPWPTHHLGGARATERPRSFIDDLGIWALDSMPVG